MAVSFSVVIPTRNRPELFRAALESVLRQTHQSLVVNDGTDEEYLSAYKAMEAEFSEAVTWLYQPRRPNGHGQSYSMNTGAYAASGNYLAFLDDDDEWTDDEHLSRAASAIEASAGAVDVMFTDQTAYRSDGSEVIEPLWLSSLASRIHQCPRVVDDVYEVDVDFLLSARGFAHLNCTIVRRDHYLSINGMDENIRYECDRDFFLRVVDGAEQLLYSPRSISRHNVPDPKKRDNMSTLVSDLEKRAYQLTVLEKNLLTAEHPRIRAYAQGGLANTYKHMADVLVRQNSPDLALQHAWQALAARYSLKWHGYCCYLMFKNWIR